MLIHFFILSPISFFWKCPAILHCFIVIHREKNDTKDSREKGICKEKGICNLALRCSHLLALLPCFPGLCPCPVLL